jgi:hypothetical protein
MLYFLYYRLLKEHLITHKKLSQTFKGLSWLRILNTSISIVCGFFKMDMVIFTLFMILMLIRHIIRSSGLNSQPIGTIVLIGLILTLILYAISLVRSALLERDIQQAPRPKIALNNELFRSITTQSRAAAYWGASGMTLVFAITWAFYPICDPVTISRRRLPLVLAPVEPIST